MLDAEWNSTQHHRLRGVCVCVCLNDRTVSRRKTNVVHGPMHYNDVIMSAMASQITSLTIVYWSVYSRCRSKKTSKLCVTGLCEGNSPVTGEFPTQKASNAENISIWWRHHEVRGNYVGRQCIHWYWWPGHLCTKRTDVLPHNIVKSRSCEIVCYNYRNPLKFDRHFGAAAEVPVEFQSDWKNIKPNLAASRLQEILR